MLFKILEIRLKSPLLVKILKALYTGTSEAVKGSKTFLGLLRDADRVALNPLYSLTYI